jgi:tubulin polyglutamylase TTLL5
MLKSDSKLVRYLFEINGLITTDRHDWNILWTNTHGMGAANVRSGAVTTSYFYERLIPYQQKLNHFPCSNQITRKDRLAINIKKMRSKYSEMYYNFIPETFVLPAEY